MYTKKSNIPWNLFFWSTHFVSLLGLLLPLFLMTPITEGFTFGKFHNTISFVELIIIFFSLGGLRTLLNRSIDWRAITFKEVLKVIVFACVVGVITQLVLYYGLHAIGVTFFSGNTTPEMYFGGPELKFRDSILKILLWVFTFFTIKMIINYNAFKLEEIALLDKVKQEQINIISGRIDADFMADSITLIKRLVHTDIHQARATLTQLSNVLRYNLTQENFERVRVHEEIAIIKNYLSLIRGQNNSKIVFDKKISSEHLDVFISPMKFQNIIKKLVNSHTTSVVIAMEDLAADTYKAQLKITNSPGQNEMAARGNEACLDLHKLFSKKEHLELEVKDHEFHSAFKIFNVEKQNTSLL